MRVCHKNLRSILKKLVANDILSFTEYAFNTLHPKQSLKLGWHIELILNKLEEVRKGKVKRLLINLPPRTLKSVCASVIWPAWVLARSPGTKIIACSYSRELSRKHSKDCRIVMESPWFKEVMPKCKLKSGANRQDKFLTTSLGFRLATSPGSTLTGEGSDIIILDDPQSPKQAHSLKQRNKLKNWYLNTLSSRLNDQMKGAIIVIMQRLHQEDFTNFLLSHDNWHHLQLPLVAEREEKITINTKKQLIRKEGDILGNTNTELVQALKQRVGAYTFQAQYQQSPTPANDGIINKGWLEYYSAPINFPAVYQSWDCALSTKEQADYSVCTTWGVKDNKYYLIHVYRARLNYPTLKNKLVELYNQYKPRCVLIENKASGMPLVQEVRKNHGDLNVVSVEPQHDKTLRLYHVLHLIEARKLYIQQGTAWLKEFLEEFLSFPNTTHDDQVDSVVQFLNWINKQTPKAETGYRLRRL